MTNPTPIESAIGDFVCKRCELPGEDGRSGPAISKCTRCRRGTARRLTKLTGPDAKPNSKAKAASAGMVPEAGAKGPTFRAQDVRMFVGGREIKSD